VPPNNPRQRTTSGHSPTESHAAGQQLPDNEAATAIYGKHVKSIICTDSTGRFPAVEFERHEMQLVAEYLWVSTDPLLQVLALHQSGVREA
jgi:hypothetical protein